MAWEERNGRRYYYRKTRIGQRVKTEYVGAGALAELLSKGDATERKQRSHQRQVASAAKQDIRKIEIEFEKAYTLIQALTSAALLVSGYHQHHGQWRMLRDEGNKRSVQ